ncbi:xylellain [Desulfosporosinus acidiphilus SJ4]|uniref:Xylellain n=1 Tax=Desulfosporosinus acidiphilus (strain DSM 22704 / JCM 16185 / SJ4) TaxID=646529 RepID=I4D553_DESAJ|nr:C1 family peptidase [Desulfosporosinus acidiphilus]AFM40927.1 xylellain [Desulfosporosinus acidiphilus SJ4]
MAKRVYKLKHDKVDARDKIFYSALHKQMTLPPLVDLRNGCSPVVDQGELGSCTANAIASGLREFQELRSGKLTPLSRLWLYWGERKLEGTVDEDSGASIRDGMKILHKFGCAPENDWPYDISKFTQTPPVVSFLDALHYKISEYHRVSDLLALKAALATRYPVVIGIKIYESFESEEVARNGIVPLPQQGEQYLGGHAVLAVGYKDDAQNTNSGVVICRNSWGGNWGESGYFFLPYAYFAENVVDMWTGK